jgi:membrane-associated phospholipid phosphatase
MKSRSAAVLFLVVIVLCAISYGFFDIPIARFFGEHKGIPKAIFERITYFGISTPYLIASAIAFIWFKFVQKRPPWANAAAFIFLAVALSGIANSLIKCLVGRSRPNLLLAEHIYGFKPFATQYNYTSFPSGHANTAAALFYALYLIRDRYWYIYIPIAVAIILSRVVLGSHFLSDVIFGSYLAVIVTSLLRTAFDKKKVEISTADMNTSSPINSEKNPAT